MQKTVAQQEQVGDVTDKCLIGLYLWSFGFKGSQYFTEVFIFSQNSKKKQKKQNLEVTIIRLVCHSFIIQGQSKLNPPKEYSEDWCLNPQEKISLPLLINSLKKILSTNIPLKVDAKQGTKSYIDCITFFFKNRSDHKQYYN